MKGTVKKIAKYVFNKGFHMLDYRNETKNPVSNKPIHN